MKKDFTLSLDEKEMLILSNSLNEILRGPAEIEEWEFHTRIGADKEEANNLHKKVLAELE